MQDKTNALPSLLNEPKVKWIYRDLISLFGGGKDTISLIRLIHGSELSGIIYRPCVEFLNQKVTL